MKRNLTKFVSAAALAAGMALAQSAPPATQSHAGEANQTVQPRRQFRRRMMEQLNLTDVQKQQAKTIFQQARQNAEPLRAQLKQNREALAAAVKANDQAKIDSLAGEQGRLAGKLVAIRAESQAKFYGILTPDQRAKADQMHQRFQQRMHERFGHKNTNG
jgi:Spy/CpxP family protein refolding chaperone